MGILDIFKISEFKTQLEQSANTIKTLEDDLEKRKLMLDEVNAFEYFDAKAESNKLINKATSDANQILNQANLELLSINTSIEQKHLELENLETAIAEASASSSKLEKNIITQTKKLSRIRELYQSIEYAVSRFNASQSISSDALVSSLELSEIEQISPTVFLRLHCMDIKDLRKAYIENNKLIDKVLSQFAERYTTKANRSIYALMVIALKAELQNIMVSLKYDKLDKSIEDIKKMTAKYLQIADDGNQSIYNTMVKFIGQIEELFINTVKIEYNYYVKKVQAREEQLALREQMRQETAERKALEAEAKKIEKEEEKFNAEIEKLNNQMLSAPDSEIEKFKARITELQNKISALEIKKEEIVNLQNGMAGNVYIISNLGSFGESMFKVGMTRRLDPQDRIDELGSASVPFKFDVHSFIFSENAVELERALHNKLSNQRVNKVNMRKEFFYSTVDELEKLVQEIEPTAEFVKTMLAEDFKQSISSDEAYTSTFADLYIDDEDE